MNDGLTPSQTAGPFFAFALTPTAYAYPALAGNDLHTDDAGGETIIIAGQIFDGAGAHVPDAMIEVWQADGAGRYASADRRANTRFKGFGRCETLGGQWSFATVKPGRVPAPNGGMQAPHINLGIFARGILKRLFTRLYFSDEASNREDPILALVVEERRSTLVATRGLSGDGRARYSLDIHLRGDRETVFFAA